MCNIANSNNANWLYFVGSKKNPIETFIYGLSVPTKCPIEYSLNIKDLGSVIEGKHLYLFRSVKNINNLPQTDNSINLDFFYSDTKYNLPNNKVISFIKKTSTIQKSESCITKEGLQSPIGSLAIVNSFYTTEFFDANFNNNTKINILKKLSDSTNQNFYGDYCIRIGCLEIIQPQEWSETNCPFHIEYNKVDNQYLFVKSNDYNKDLNVVFKRYISENEKVYEKLIHIPKEQELFVLNDSSDDDYGYEYSVYDSNGTLIHDDCVYFVRQIVGNITALGNSQKVIDKYSSIDKNLTKITSSTTSSFIVNANNVNKTIEELNNNYKQLKQLIKNENISEKEGMWFPPSDDKLSKIINYINHLHSQKTKITIVDPYADDEILNLAIRLNTMSIKIIASKKALPKASLLENSNKILQLKNQYNNVGFGINKISYYFINKDFHDRFILFDNNDEKNVYCFPNSLNAMTKNCDYLIIKLNGKVKQECLNHINQLNSLCNEDNLLENLKYGTDE